MGQIIMTLTNIKKGLAAAIATSLLALSVSAPVNAATGTTTVGVTINEFVVLYYFDEIAFAITAADLVQHIDSTADGTNSSVEESSEDLGDLNISANAITGDAGITIVDPTPAGIAVTINNAWAVSSVDDGALSIAVTNAGGLTNGSETITTSSVGSSTTIATAGLDIQTGNIVFTMDIGAVATGGEYTGDFVITVNNT